MRNHCTKSSALEFPSESRYKASDTSPIDCDGPYIRSIRFGHDVGMNTMRSTHQPSENPAVETETVKVLVADSGPITATIGRAP